MPPPEKKIKAEPAGAQRWILFGVVIVYVAMRVYRGAAVCMDGDEIFSVGVASHDWKGLLAAVGADSIHPPLFYFLLKLWMALGNDGLFWVRLLPTLFSTLAIVPMVLLGREFRLRPAVITSAVALAALHPLIVYYSQHVRMYTLLMLFALASIWAFHVALREPVARAFAILTVLNILAVYSHYYGWLVVGLECAYVILWKRARWKPMMASSAATLIAFTPWIYWAGKYAVAKGGLASNLEWIDKPTAAALAWFFVDLAGFGDFPSIGKQAVAVLALLVLAAAIAAWLDRARLHAADFIDLARYLLYFVFGSVLVAFTASRLLPNSVWGHRHMLYLVFPVLLVVSAAYYRFKSRAVRITGGFIFSIWAFMVIQHQVKGDDKKTPFDTLVVQMLAQEAATSGPLQFYSVDKYLHYPIWYYLETLKARKITGFAAPIPSADRDRLAAEAARIHVNEHVDIADARGSHFWVGYTSAWTEKLSPEAILSQRGCRVGSDVTVRDRYHASTIFPVWCENQR